MSLLYLCSFKKRFSYLTLFLTSEEHVIACCVFKIAQAFWAGVPGAPEGQCWCLDPCCDPPTLCNAHPVMAHAALPPLLIPEPYCSLFVLSSFFPWAPGQWEEKVTVNIALKSSLPPIELLKMEQATSGWALPSCAGHFNCKTSNKYESLNVKDCCIEIICSVLTLQ